MGAAVRPLVLGRPGLVFDLVTRALDDTMVDAPLIVAVDPTPGDWDKARSSDGRIVLVCAGGVTADAAAEKVLDGADAVLDGSIAADDLRAAVRRVAAGETVLDGWIARALVERARSLRREPVSPAARLSERELQILDCIERGLSVKQTARELGVADKTIENLQSRLYRKLDVRNRAPAVARAHDLGLFG
jgi:DNA-binding NarL/FixJ family response regulator